MGWRSCKKAALREKEMTKAAKHLRLSNEDSADVFLAGVRDLSSIGLDRKPLPVHHPLEASVWKLHRDNQQSHCKGGPSAWPHAGDETLKLCSQSSIFPVVIVYQRYRHTTTVGRCGPS